MSKLKVGDPFPDLPLDSNDGPVSIRERWGGMPLVVAFMRHFG
jgi:hypothetical protein